MCKKCFILLLSLLATVNSFTQDIDLVVQRKVDSLRSLLPGAKGRYKVDLLNSIAQGLLFIWEGDDQYFRDAMKLSDEAYRTARQLNYKTGMGYALANLFFREGHPAGSDRQENYKPGSHFLKAMDTANLAIEIGQSLHDEFLLGIIYNRINWMNKWKGKREDYEASLEQSISHLEKAIAGKNKPTYRPLSLTDCASCTGVEFQLGGLYREKAQLSLAFRDETVQLLRKSADYYEKAQALSSAAGIYLSIANTLSQYQHIRTAITEANKALAFYTEQNDKDGIFNSYQLLCNFFYEMGDLENGLLYSRNLVKLAEQLSKEKGPRNEVNYPGDNQFLSYRRLFNAYYWASRFYTLGGDYEQGMWWLNKASAFNFENRWAAAYTSAMGNLYRMKGDPDSAVHYLNNKSSLVSLVRAYNDQQQYDKAIQTFNEAYVTVKDRNNLANLGRLESYAARSYYGKNQAEQALQFASHADRLFEKMGNNLERIDNYLLLSDIYQKTGRYDSAYLFLRQYNKLRDSVLNKQFYIRLNAIRKEAEEDKRTGQIQLLQKDILIKEQQLREELLLKQGREAQLSLLSKDNLIKGQLLRLQEQQLLLKDQSLRQQQFWRRQKESDLALLDKDNRLKGQQLRQQVLLRNALLGGLFLFLIIAFVSIRLLLWKQKNERLRQQNRLAELEMQALRAQMNPHFIFNCLSSINRFILKNESQSASDYLTRFSRLIRRVLTHSQLSSIPLSDELEMLGLYLDMERLRFDQAFDYHITLCNTIEPEMIYVPPLLFQPFCENSIWHGLMHKEGKGKLEINLEMKGYELHCTITDNGIGRARASVFNKKGSEKDRSLGLQITKDRLALFNKTSVRGEFVYIEDVLNHNLEVAGTRVKLIIQCGSKLSTPSKITV